MPDEAHRFSRLFASDEHGTDAREIDRVAHWHVVPWISFCADHGVTALQASAGSVDCFLSIVKRNVVMS
jgi:hypothetical protein